MSDRFGYGEIGLGIESGENDKQTTNADRIRSMSDEELALWLARFTDCGECPINAYPHCTTSEESCACRWHEWLKEEVKT